MWFRLFAMRKISVELKYYWNVFLSLKRTLLWLATCSLKADRDRDTKRTSFSGVMDYKKYFGRCIFFFLLAVLFDAVGVILFFLGIFAPLSFWDFFVLSGPIAIFVSLFFWIFWYLGNITVPTTEFLPK